MERYEAPVRHQRCPTCGNALTQSTDLMDDGGHLEPGDLAICDQCGGFLVMGTDGLVSAVADETVRNETRFEPRSKEWLLEAQRAVRAKARLVVTKDADGQRTVTMVSQPPGRKVDYGKN